MERKTAWINLNKLKTHTFITGGSGCGKSEVLKVMIYRLAKLLGKKKKGSIVLIDPHGQLASQVAKIDDISDHINTIFIKPTSGYDGFSCCINPFETPDLHPDTISTISGEFTVSFDNILKNSSLSEQMKTLLVPCTSTLLRREGSSLHDLQRFMDDTRNEDLVQCGLESPIAAEREFFKYSFYKKNLSPTKDGISMRTQSLLLKPEFYNSVIGNSTINIYKALDGNNLIIFNLADLSGDTNEAFGRFLVTLIQSHAMRRDLEQNKDEPPIFLFIDEFQNYVNNSLEKILTQARKFGLHLILACQMLGQDTTTKERNAILSNTGTKIIGRNSITTLRHMAAETGIPLEKLQALPDHEFYVKHTNNQALRLKTPSYLVKNDLHFPPEKWSDFLHDQHSKHYRHATFNDQTKEDIQNHKFATDKQPSFDDTASLEDLYNNMQFKIKKKKQ